MLTKEEIQALVGRWDRACRIGGIAASAPIRAELDTAAPDLARTALAALARAEDAEAMVEALRAWFRRRYSNGHDEYCAAKGKVNRNCSCGWDTLSDALAPDAGIKALAELRAERDRFCVDWGNQCRHSGNLQDKLDAAEAENADLRTHLAEAEALVGALDFYSDEDDWQAFEGDARDSAFDRNIGSKLGSDRGQIARAALASAQGVKP